MYDCDWCAFRSTCHAPVVNVFAIEFVPFYSSWKPCAQSHERSHDSWPFMKIRFWENNGVQSWNLVFAISTMIILGRLATFVWLLHHTYCDDICILHCRYDMASNRWCEESHVPRKAPSDSSFGFVVLDGELHVISLLKAVRSAETRRLRHHKKPGTLYIQIYNPKRKSWRSLITKPPFQDPLDFNTAVICTIRLWTNISCFS